MKTFLSFLFIVYLGSLSAQGLNIEVSRQVSLLREGQSSVFYGTLDSYMKKNPTVVLDVLSPYRTDDKSEIRKWVYGQYSRILDLFDSPLSMRQDIVLLIVDGISDSDPLIRENCVDYLIECSRKDFSSQATDLFCTIFNSKSWFSKDLVLLAGFIGNDECQKTLEELSITSRKLLWHIKLALSRMGDLDAESWCLSQIERIGINDDVTFDLLPGLVYTHQKRSFDFLVSILNSDEKLCSSSNPDYDGSILCGYRVMEYLAPVVKGFPLKLLPSGDIDTNDYHKALLTVRKWFIQRDGEFEILSERF